MLLLSDFIHLKLRYLIVILFRCLSLFSKASQPEGFYLILRLCVETTSLSLMFRKLMKPKRAHFIVVCYKVDLISWRIQAHRTSRPTYRASRRTKTVWFVPLQGLASCFSQIRVMWFCFSINSNFTALSLLGTIRIPSRFPKRSPFRLQFSRSINAPSRLPINSTLVRFVSALTGLFCFMSISGFIRNTAFCMCATTKPQTAESTSSFQPVLYQMSGWMLSPKE